MIVILQAKIIGGVVLIQPEFEFFRNCYFERTEIRMETQQENVFLSCYFDKCDLDEVTKSSVRTGNNIVETASVEQGNKP